MTAPTNMQLRASSSRPTSARGQRAACAPTVTPAAHPVFSAATSPGVNGRRGLCLSRGV